MSVNAAFTAKVNVFLSRSIDPEDPSAIDSGRALMKDGRDLGVELIQLGLAGILTAEVKDYASAAIANKMSDIEDAIRANKRNMKRAAMKARLIWDAACVLSPLME